MRKYVIITLVLLCLPRILPAQAWSGLIDPTRATDWSSVGVVGDIPSTNWANCTTAACNTLFGGSVTATTISNALTSCPSNQVVRIPAGSYTIGAFNDTQSNCVLRGQGADQTKIRCTSGNSGGGLGGTNNPCIHLMSGATGVATFGGVTTANWTAGYSQGTTVITLSSTTGLVAGPVGTGSLIMLEQLDDSSDGYPAAGFIYACTSTANNCSNQGGNNYGFSGRSEMQVVTVTNISGNNVTISPGLAYPNWRSGQSPQAYWVSQLSAVPIHNAGIEDFSLDFSTSGVQGIYIMNAANCWIKGMRIISTVTGTQETYHVFVMQSQHITIRSNYIYGRPTTVSPFPLANYAYTDQEVSDVLVENNIWQHNTESFAPNDPGGRNVFSYNFITGDTVGVAGIQYHSGVIMMDLNEGNDWQSSFDDITHGTHFFLTYFRNLYDGTQNNNSSTNGAAMVDLTNNRLMNYLGNVCGSTSYGQYQVTLGSGGMAACYDMGWMGNTSGTPVTNDSNVLATSFRWGNWDNFNSANPTGTNDATGTRFVNSEVPSGITYYSNAIPATHILPPSLYLGGPPAWFGSVTFPPIGPDVANGNATNTSGTPSGGHANLIPARACFQSAIVDPAYSGLSPQPKIFNANSCYPLSQGPPGAPPAGLLLAGTIQGGSLQ